MFLITAGRVAWKCQHVDYKPGFILLFGAVHPMGNPTETRTVVLPAPAASQWYEICEIQQ